MKFLKPLLAVALISSLSVVNANAIGNREKGALIGAGALLLLPTMVENFGQLFGNNQRVDDGAIRYQSRSQPVVVHEKRVVVVNQKVRRNKNRDFHQKRRYNGKQEVIIIQR
jgi:hypothetical protein